MPMATKPALKYTMATVHASRRMVRHCRRVKLMLANTSSQPELVFLLLNQQSVTQFPVISIVHGHKTFTLIFP